MLKKHELGIGLVEVMVSLLLLAVAILGFSVLQMSATKASDEGIVQGKVVAIIRGAAETMRAHESSIGEFAKVLDYATTKTNPPAKPNFGNCNNAKVSCSPKQLAELDAARLYHYAKDNGVNIAMADCPGTDGTSQKRKKYCMIASWGDTIPTMSSHANACADVSGAYKREATCFIMETY